MPVVSIKSPECLYEEPNAVANVRLDSCRRTDDLGNTMTQAQLTSLDKLKHALELGAIDQDTFDMAAAAINAQLSGGGAIAQGRDALAIGAGGVGVGRDNYGDFNTGLIIQQAARPGASKEDLRRAYLARILTQANQLLLFAGDSANAQVRLSSVYTALLTERSDGDAAVERTARDAGASPERGAPRLSALDVLNAERKLVLLGGPGSGKSTFANFVALCMAGEMLGATAINLKTLVLHPARAGQPRPETPSAALGLGHPLAGACGAPRLRQRVAGARRG